MGLGRLGSARIYGRLYGCALQPTAKVATEFWTKGPSKFQALLSPLGESRLEPFVLWRLDWKLLGPQAPEAIEHLAEDIDRESPVLLGCESKQIGEPVAGDHRSQVHEVPCLGSAENGQHLVYRQLPGTQDGQPGAGLDWEQPGVSGQVDLGDLALPFYGEANESRAFPDSTHQQASFPESVFDLREQTIDIGALEPKEVKVSRASIDVAIEDQRSTAREREAIGRLQVGDDLGDLPL